MSSAFPAGRIAVTGASSGIGATYAQRLAVRGHDLLIVARRADRLADLARNLSQQHGVDVATLTADLEDPADLALLEDRLAAEPFAGLINNAGAGGLGPIATQSADQLERIVRLNVTALTRLSQAALTGFKARGQGVLVNIGSVMAHAPSGGGAVYSGSKAYVLNFTRSLQLEFAGTGVKVQLIMPGPIQTEFFTSQGLSNDVFPASAYLTPDQLVDAALAGLDAGEAVTVPSLVDPTTWDSLETARQAFMGQIGSGTVAPRYRVSEPA